MSEDNLRSDALQILKAALDAADAGNAVRRHLSSSRAHLSVGSTVFNTSDFDRVFLLAVGKAAVPMAAAVEEVVGEYLKEGLAVTKHEHANLALARCRILEAAHPIPDAAGESASEAVGVLLRQLDSRDLLLVAVSGGASALLPAPAPGLTLAQKQQTTDLLLRAGANIRELNAVRKHLSVLKGGRLAALAAPATVVGLLLSDVIGDPLDVIGSGLTAADSSTFNDALLVLDRFRLRDQVPLAVRKYLEEGAAGLRDETPKADDPMFKRVLNVVIGSNRLALEAAAAEAKQLGYRTMILSSTIEGETREIASMHSQILCEVLRSGNPMAAPVCILSGGETTVTIHGRGKGGRNQEFALAAGQGIAGLENLAVLSIGTDGTDGPTDAAGAIVTGSTAARAAALQLDMSDHLRNNDSYRFFDALGDLIRTGPTGTNVMDLHVMLAG